MRAYHWLRGIRTLVLVLLLQFSCTRACVGTGSFPGVADQAALGVHGGRLLSALSLPDERGEERARLLAALDTPLRSQAASAPSDAGAQLALGLYNLYGRHDPISALPELRRAAGLQPQSPDTRIHTALCRLAYPLWLGEGEDPGAYSAAALEGAYQDALAHAPVAEAARIVAAARLRGELLRAYRETRAAVLRQILTGNQKWPRFTTRTGRCQIAIPPGARAVYTQTRDPGYPGSAVTAALFIKHPIRWELRRVAAFDPTPLYRSCWMRARLHGDDPPLEWIATVRGSVWLTAPEARRDRQWRRVLVAAANGCWQIDATAPPASAPFAFTAQDAMALTLAELPLQYPDPQQPPDLLAPPETVAVYLRALAERSDWLNLRALGHSIAGRPLLAATLSDPNRATPMPRKLLAIARQHGNEPAPTAACLALLSRLVQAPPASDASLLSRVGLAVVPVANPDGAAAFTRGNANGANPNRDWRRLAYPETVAIDHFRRQEWPPDLFLDLHEMLPEDNAPGYYIQLPPDIDRLTSTGKSLLRQARLTMARRIRADHCPVHISRFEDADSLAHTEMTRQGIPALLLESQVARSGIKVQLERRLSFHVEGLLGAMEALANAP